MHYRIFILLTGLLFFGIALTAQPDSLFVSGKRIKVPADDIKFVDSKPEGGPGLLLIDGKAVKAGDIEKNYGGNSLNYRIEASNKQSYLYLPNIAVSNWLNPDLARIRFGARGKQGALVIKTRNYSFQQGFKWDLSMGQGLLTPLRAQKAGLPEERRKTLLGAGSIQRYRLGMQYEKRQHFVFVESQLEQRLGPVTDAFWQAWHGKFRYEIKLADRIRLEAVTMGKRQAQRGILGELFVDGPSAGRIWGADSIVADRSLALQHWEGLSFLQLKWYLDRWNIHTKVFGHLTHNVSQQSFGAALFNDSLDLFTGIWKEQVGGVHQSARYRWEKGEIGAMYQGQLNRWAWEDGQSSEYQWSQQQAQVRARFDLGAPLELNLNAGGLQASHLEGILGTWNLLTTWRINRHRRFYVMGVRQLDMRAFFSQNGQDPLESLPSLAAGQGLIIPQWGWPWLNDAPVPGRAVDLGWERKRSMGLGWTLGTSGWLPTLSLDLYRRAVQDLAVVGGVEGEQPMLQNAGTGHTEGLELYATFLPGSRHDYHHRINVTLTGMRTRVAKTVDDLPLNLYAGTSPVSEAFRMVPGDPLSGIYGYASDGYYAAGDNRSLEPEKGEGDIRLIDQNEDGQITPDDRILLGQSLPSWTFNTNYIFDREPWRASIGFSAQWGNQILRYHELDKLQPGETRPTDQLVQGAALLRLRRLVVSYQVPNQKRPNHGLELFLKGENLWFLTGYRGFDPMINSAMRLPGPIPSIDFGAYPTPRIILVGVNYQFR